MKLFNQLFKGLVLIILLSSNNIIVKSSSSSETVSVCLNNCSGNGVCQESICNCDQGFSGVDCSIIINHNTTTCLGSPKCGGPSQGICTDQGCVCISPWVGQDCESQIITFPPTISPNEPIVEYSNITSCEFTGNGIIVTSFSKISCTGYGETYCTDNNSGSTCSTDSSNGIITCTVKNKLYLNNSSITCIGNKIECKVLSNIACSLNLEGDFIVNDIISNSNLVIFNNDQQININGIDQQLQSSSTSQSLNINLYLVAGFILLLLISSL